MDKSRKKSAVLFVCILLVLGMWMMLSVYSQAAGTNNDEKQAQTIRVGSFEDTFNYVDKNGEWDIIGTTRENSSIYAACVA